MYDPYTRQCHPAICPPGFKLDANGKCVHIYGDMNGIDGLCCQRQKSLIFFGIDRPRGYHSSREVDDEDMSCFLQRLNISDIRNNSNWIRMTNFGSSVSKELLMSGDEKCDMTRDLDTIFLHSRDMFSRCNQDYVSYVYMCDTFPYDKPYSGVWFQGQATEFSSSDGAFLDQILVYKGKHILPEMVLHQVSYSYDFIGKIFVKESTVAVLGEKIGLRPSTCSLITLKRNSYHTYKTANGTRILQIGNIKLGEDEYILYGNGRVQVCANNVLVSRILPEDGSLALVNTIGTGLSLCGLFLTFAIFCYFKDLRNLHGLFIMNFTVALFIAQLSSLLTSKLTSIPKVSCLIMAVISHFSWLASFTWTTIIAINLLRVFTVVPKESQVQNGRNKSHFIAPICGWGIPFLITMSSVAINEHLPVYNQIVPCWMASPTSNLIAFGVPVAVSQFANTILFVITVIKACRSQRRSRLLQRSKQSFAAFLRDCLLCFKVQSIKCHTVSQIKSHPNCLL